MPNRRILLTNEKSAWVSETEDIHQRRSSPTPNMAPPSDADDLTPKEERELRQRVIQGLQLALKDKGLSDREITKTETEKLLFFANNDLDLKLTHSWYLAGGDTLYKSSSSSTGTVSPQEPGTRSYGSIEAQPSVDPDIQRYREYFRDTEFFDGYDLGKVNWADKHEFLYDYYEAFAPQKYTDLYLYSTRLREQLENLDKEIEKGSADTSLTKWGGGSDDGVLSRNKENKIRRTVSLLHLELAGLDGFEETRTPVHRGTDVIENVLTKLTRLQSVTDEQARLVNELGDFFYNYVWKYPALKISVETASGSNAGRRKQLHQTEFDSFDATLMERIEQLIEEHEDAGLTPSVDDFAANENTQEMTAIHNLTMEVINPDE